MDAEAHTPRTIAFRRAAQNIRSTIRSNFRSKIRIGPALVCALLAAAGCTHPYSARAEEAVVAELVAQHPIGVDTRTWIPPGYNLDPARLWHTNLDPARLQRVKKRGQGPLP